jgi:hypothetical protein
VPLAKEWPDEPVRTLPIGTLRGFDPALGFQFF